jgi:hypothetical protein
MSPGTQAAARRSMPTPDSRPTEYEQVNENFRALADIR